ncbi:MAG: ABC transporter permease [Clostridia bacterium]|nr:ABC transporter permease [Clostridia bacterium]
MAKNGKRALRSRGRVYQIPIYFGKLLRGFVYMNDWKVLPMAAAIAALVSMVVRRDFFATMEGTLKGAFALSCVAIWNGCFNSIQVICRERGILKREHRSGLHITSYIFSHMLYQALLCLAQTVITVYVCNLCGVKLNAKGFITRSLMIDIGTTVFLVSYASDMLSLLVSAIAHSTTAAMTVMPFLLIFQLVFSGGIFTLPAWANGLSNITISNYGLRCIAAQADYNHLPLAAGWDSLVKIEDEPISGETTAGELLSVAGKLTGDDSRLSQIIDTATVMVAADPAYAALAEEKIPFTINLKDVIDGFGREELKASIQERTSASRRNERYEQSWSNITTCWWVLFGFSMLYAVLATVVLEFIDRDKR